MIKQIFNSLWRGLWPFVATVVVVLLGAWMYRHHEINHPSTADAILYNDVIPISPSISGTVTTVSAQLDQWVQQGDLLFTIDPRPYQLAVKKAQNQLVQAKQTLAENQAAVLTAKANLSSAQSALNLAKIQYNRKADLLKTGAISPSDRDVAQQALQAAQATEEVTEAGVATAQAQLGDANYNVPIKAAELAIEEAELNLSYTRVTAPQSGYVTNFNLIPGQSVTSGEALFGIVENSAWRIHADILEPFLKNIRVGQSAHFRLLMYPGKIFEGVVSGIGYGVAIDGWQNKQALSQVSPSFDWISVAKRFPVIITVTTAHDQVTTPFRVGSSVILDIDTTQNKGS